MILNVGKSIEIFLGGVVNTNQLPFTSSYVDINRNAKTFVPGDVQGLTNDITAVEITASPTGADQRQLKEFTVYNADTTFQQITIQLNDVSIPAVRILVSIALQVGDTLFYSEDEGYKVMDQAGGIKVTSASLGGGTVTNFSSGNLPPLFTTNVVAPGTTPSQSFSQISKNANLVFASPNGAPGFPFFRALVPADLPPATAGVVPVVAQAVITAFDPVTSDGFVADSTNILQKNKIAGIALANIAIGFSGDIVVTGKITNPAWAWTIGPPVYINGPSLSQTPPVSGVDAFSLIIGLATGTDTIDVDIKQAFQF